MTRQRGSDSYLATSVIKHLLCALGTSQTIGVDRDVWRELQHHRERRRYAERARLDPSYREDLQHPEQGTCGPDSHALARPLDGLLRSRCPSVTGQEAGGTLNPRGDGRAVSSKKGPVTPKMRVTQGYWEEIHRQLFLFR